MRRCSSKSSAPGGEKTAAGWDCGQSLCRLLPGPQSNCTCQKQHTGPPLQEASSQWPRKLRSLFQLSPGTEELLSQWERGLDLTHFTCCTLAAGEWGVELIAYAFLLSNIRDKACIRIRLLTRVKSPVSQFNSFLKFSAVYLLNIIMAPYFTLLILEKHSLSLKVYREEVS